MTLRERAEQMLRTSRTDVAGMRSEDVQSLVYELQVHQMELEIQNEELRQAQVELAESRDRYSDLYEFAPVGYLSLDRAGRILAANLRAVAMLHVDRKDLVGAKLSDFVQPGSQDDWYRNRRTLFDSEKKQVCDLAMHRQDGTSFWARAECALHHPPSGREPECRAALLDVTEAREAAELLHKLNVELEQMVGRTTAELHDRVHEAALLAKAIAGLTEGVLITDDELNWPGPRIAFVNEAMCRITGYSADELIGGTPRILQGEQTDRETMAQLKRELVAGRPFSCEVVNYRKDGTPYDAEIYIVPLFDAEGNRTNFVSIHRDVTEKKQAAQALKESEAFTRSVLASPVANIAILESDGRILAVNAAWEAFARENADPHLVHSGVGANYLEICRAARDGGDELAGEALDGLQAVIDGTRTIFSLEYPCHSPIEQRWFQMTVTPAQIEQGGVVVAHLPITERKVAEQALQDREVRLSAILNTANDAIITIDRSGSINDVNPATEAMFGYTAAELTGRNVKILMPPPYRDEHDGYIRSYLETGEAKMIGSGREVQGRRKNGTVFPVELSVSEADHLGLFTGIVRDITERKAERERLIQSERLAALGEAMAGLTHESRNALTRSQSNLRRLARRLKGDDELLQLIEGALRASEDVRRQFEEVRDYAAPVQLRREPLDLPRIVRQAWDELSMERKGRRAELRVNGEEIDLHCAGDVHLLRNVFRNILENSLAACDDPVAIDIDFSEAQIDELPALRISIRDNGPGLPSEIASRAFDAFFTTKTRGTGLGLAIVKRAVEAHGGEVAIGSPGAAGSGAEIHITLPRSQP